MALLASADALLFVTDASAELSSSELEFLEQASQRCPTVIAALTKTDLYPEWRRVHALDQQRLTPDPPNPRPDSAAGTRKQVPL